MFKRIVEGIRQASTDACPPAGTRRDDDGRDAAAQAGSTLSTAGEALQRGSDRLKGLGSSSRRWLKQAASRLPSERPDLKSLTEMARAAKENVAARRDAVQARLSDRKASPFRNGASGPSEEAGSASPAGTSALDAHAKRGIEQLKGLGSTSQRWLKQAASKLPSERPDLKSLTEMARAAKDNVAAQRDALHARMGGRTRAPASVGAACEDANERLQADAAESGGELRLGTQLEQGRAGLDRARSVAASAVTQTLGQHLPEARRPGPSPEAIASCDGGRPVTGKAAGDSDRHALVGR